MGQNSSNTDVGDHRDFFPSPTTMEIKKKKTSTTWWRFCCLLRGCAPTWLLSLLSFLFSISKMLIIFLVFSIPHRLRLLDLTNKITSVQFSSVAQSCPTPCDPMNCSAPGLSVHHQLPEFTQTPIHRVHDAIQSSYPLSSPAPLTPYTSQHQSLFQWVNSSHDVAKVLEFQL